ncbi:MAG: NAD/NADP octopine/nopaline dehydrogenase family protein [Candidatus Sumerlaeota bacterium]|nr:NAD/NADP octopine/nopaline dehydrogenase family protein [Candidatus Sumerlaeota bacterium]
MSDKKPVFCVIGAGNGGMAMAGHLGLMGFGARLYNRSPERLLPIQARGGIELEGEVVEGFGQVALATTDAKEAVAGADVVMVVTPASAHEDIAGVCAPHLRAGQIVVLNPGRTFGALAFRKTLTEKGCAADVLIAETQTFLYACRITGPAQARIFQVKNAVPLATIRAFRIPECLAVVRQAFPQFVPGDDVFKTSFGNIAVVFHPAIMLMNAGWVEDAADFEFYHEGVTPAVGHVLEKLDAERVAVAGALGFQATTAKEWLYYAYDAVGKNLRSAIRANLGYRGILAPHQMDMRYVTEDVPFSLVPMSSVARKFDVKVPLMDTFIDLASAVMDCDYRKEGRTVEKVGIADLTLQQIRLLAIGEQP